MRFAKKGSLLFVGPDLISRTGIQLLKPLRRVEVEQAQIDSMLEQYAQRAQYRIASVRSIGELVAKSKDHPTINGLYAKIAECVFDNLQMLAIFGFSHTAFSLACSAVYPFSINFSVIFRASSVSDPMLE